MIELPEAIAFSKQINDTLVGKKIRNALKGQNPHKFAFPMKGSKQIGAEYSDEDFDRILKGKSITKSCSNGNVIFVQMDSDYLLSLGCGGEKIIYHKTEYRERRDHFAYLACSEPVAGFDTQREAFLGAYRGWDSPAGVEAGQLSNSVAHGWQPVGVQQVKVELAAGEQKKVIFILGYHENPVDEKFDPPNSQTINKRSVLPVIKKYLQPDVVDSAFQTMREHWDELLNIYQEKRLRKI